MLGWHDRGNVPRSPAASGSGAPAQPASRPLSDAVAECARKLRALRDARARQPDQDFAWRAEGEGDDDGAETDAERADVEPEIAAIGVVKPAAGPGTQRHAEGRGHVDCTEHRSHDPRAEIFAHENGVERHHRAVSKPEHQREAIKAREVAGEYVKADGQRLEREAEDDYALGADAIGGEPADDATAERRYARRAEHGGGGHCRHAAVNRVADHVEDRPRMCCAAGEVGKCDGGELWRAKRARHGELALAWADARR